MKPSASPDAVAHQINSLYEELHGVANKGLDLAISLGKLLHEQKQRCKHGDWEEWLELSTNVPKATAWRYIKLYENKSVLKDNAILTISGAYEKLIPKKAQTFQVEPSDSDSESVTHQNEPPATDPEPSKSNGKPAHKSPSKPKPVFDEIGTQIPSDALPFWSRSQEIQDLLTAASKLKCAVEKGKSSGDPMFSKVSQGIIAHLTQTYSLLQEAKPYAVCTTCMGSFSVQPKGCSFCGNKGLISKWQWDTQSRKEIKDIRIRAVAAARA